MRTTRPSSGKSYACASQRALLFLSLFALDAELLANRGASYDSSSLSHEFYQVLVGDPRMTIHGWKQLAEWSIEHSCLTDSEITYGKKIHAKEWEDFCSWIVENYEAYETMEELV